MAKTVIKQGTNPNYEYVSKCRVCGTIFKYEYSDMDGDPIQAWHEPHITCPTCGLMMAMNDKPIKEITVNLPELSLYRSNACILIEPGMEAYIVYRNGSTYLLKALSEDDLSPNRATILLVNATSKLTIVPGVEIQNPMPNLEYALIDEIGDNDYAGYSTFNVSELEVVPIDSNEHIFGVPSQLIESTVIQVIE